MRSNSQTRGLGVVSVTLLVVALALAGCDARDSATATPGGDGSTTEAEAPAEVRIGYFANLTHAQAVLGVASGDFEKAIAPSKVKTRVFNAGPSLVEALFAGEIDLGYIGPGPAVSAHAKSKGRGIRIVAGAAANGVAIVARDGAGITKLEDLKGKRIATPQHGNTQDIAARYYLQHELKQDNPNNIVPIANAEQSGLMARGEIDAAWAPEPWAARLVAEAKGKIIAEEKDLWPSKQFTLTLIVTTPEFLEKHPDVVEKILKQHRVITANLQKDPKGQLPALEAGLFALTGKKLPEGVLADAITRVQFTEDPLEDTLVRMAQWSYEVGFLTQPPKVDGLVDTTILRKLQTSASSVEPQQGGTP
ncbi:MAG: aliphatic sulfonate ABC transporter substrate-binding protein [Tepidisphaeraceae bacterium]